MTSFQAATSDEVKHDSNVKIITAVEKQLKERKKDEKRGRMKCMKEQ